MCDCAVLDLFGTSITNVRCFVQAFASFFFKIFAGLITGWTWWKVRNVGEIAERKNEIRGQIEKKWWNYKTEDTMFGGPHFVECYVIKNGECVAMQWIQVHIGEASI